VRAGARVGRNRVRRRRRPVLEANRRRGRVPVRPGQRRHEPAAPRLPGLTISLSQDLRFLGPADIGERSTAAVEVDEDLGDDRYRLTTTVHDDTDEVIVEGEAVVLIDTLPDEGTGESAGD
jgi:hypothetical protein